MSLIEHEKAYEIVKENCRCFANFDTSEYIRFHLFINPSLKKAYVTAYSLFPSYRRIIIGSEVDELLTLKGFNPSVGLLFSDIKERDLRRLSKEMEKLKEKKFHYSQLVRLLRKYLKLEEKKLKEVININASKVLKRYITRV